MRRPVLVGFLTMTLLGSTATPAEGIDRPRVAAHRAAGRIRVDGVLSEPDWERTPPITAFRLIEVREGEAPSESTDVRVLVDDAHVFFGVRCWNRGPGPIRASLSPRDQILDDDHVAIHLDTYRDLRRAYIFGVNAYGVQLDGILDGADPDFSWDTVWDAECTRDSTGWTAEMAIPLRSLRFPAEGGRWGLWIRRQITKRDEVCSWPPYRMGEAGAIMLQAGDLEGLDGLRGGGRAEIQPYAASTAFSTLVPDATGTGEAWRHDRDRRAGLDLKYGLTSTLTANLTLNPDYSQIEADALQVDVNQRFPLFYPEKRPFFLEGAETFAAPFSLVYTRRLADPAYGGKLIGRLGRWQVGAIAARDDGGGSTDGIGARSDGGVARPGYFGIGRVICDIGENSTVGLLATSHTTDRLGVPVPAGTGLELPSGTGNQVLAADIRLRLGRSLFLRSQLAGSWSRADTLGNKDTLVTYAYGTRHRFFDHASTVSAWWDDGTRYALVHQDYLGSDFRADAGFLERVDVRTSGYEASFRIRPENRWLRYIKPIGNGDVIRDTRGVLQERLLAGAVEWGLQQQTFVETRATHLEERWLARVYDRWRYSFEVANSLWRPLSVDLSGALEDGIFYGPSDSASYLGWQESYVLQATARPSPRLTSALSATRSRFSRSRGGAQVYDVWLLGARTTYQFTRRLYVRVYPQYDTDAAHLDADALLAYVLHPGSVLYVGVGGDLDGTGKRRRTTAQTVFLKLSYVFQV
jgi:hypothetical protein